MRAHSALIPVGLALLLTAGCASTSSTSGPPDGGSPSTGSGDSSGSSSSSGSSGSSGSAGGVPSGSSTGSAGTPGSAGSKSGQGTTGTGTSGTGDAPIVVADSSRPGTQSGGAQPGSAGGSAGGTSDTGTRGGQGGSAEPAVPPGTAQTPGERRDAIGRRLDDSLGTFDETLRKEQERTAQERDERAADATAGSSEGDTSGDVDGDGEPDEPGGTAEPEGSVVAGTNGEADPAATRRPGGLKSDREAGGTNSTTATGSGAGARNIPDGSDDDIVARRLRKAAEQETDPELKEKLWQEYIEYKKNSG